MKKSTKRRDGKKTGLSMKGFGLALYRARTRGKLTQQDVADEVGVSRVSITYWESGDSFPRPHHLAALRKVRKLVWPKVWGDWLRRFAS